MTIFHLLLLVLAFSTESTADMYTCSSQTVQYDELLLVLQWPPSFCNTEKSNCDYSYRIPDKFTVHGLWLNKNSDHVNCNKEDEKIKLSPQIKGNLRRDMEKYWPNLKSPNYPERFWVSEYAKHGCCSPEFRNQVKYFRTALAIAEEIGDVMTMRLSSEQALEMGKRYHVKDFDSVTIASRTFNPSLRCNNVNGRLYPQLKEIVFCTDTEKNLKRCTTNDKQKACSGQFELPQVPASCPAVPFPSTVNCG